MKQLPIQTSGSRGFTIIELVIVLLVVIVLLSFGVPRYRDAIERARSSGSGALARSRMQRQLPLDGASRFAVSIGRESSPFPAPGEIRAM